MTYSGKQIRIELVIGTTEVWLGSMWALSVDKGGAVVYNTHKQSLTMIPAADIVRISEDQYSEMKVAA